jgi:hypothetical protein
MLFHVAYRFLASYDLIFNYSIHFQLINRLIVSAPPFIIILPYRAVCWNIECFVVCAYALLCFEWAGFQIQKLINLHISISKYPNV